MDTSAIKIICKCIQTTSVLNKIDINSLFVFCFLLFLDPATKQEATNTVDINVTIDNVPHARTFNLPDEFIQGLKYLLLQIIF